MTEYACSCLNVRIRPQPTDSDPPELGESDYTPVYAGDRGIAVIHRQFTLRTRTPDAHKNGPFQHTSLTCLLCRRVVYRVVQPIAADIDGTERSMGDWSEQAEGVLNSISGWIELSTHCLFGSAIAKAAASPSYSSTFFVVLPSSPTPPPALSPYAPSSSPDESAMRSGTRSFLPPLAALFPPVPFTPSHPLFGHLAFIASERSQTLRHAAEEEISRLIAVKSSEIEQEEAELRRQVQVLWMWYRENEDKLEKENLQSRQTARDSSAGSQGNGTSSGRGTPHAIHDFVPLSPPKPRVTSPSAASRNPSALSTSLATSVFHHSKGRGEDFRRQIPPTGAVGDRPSTPRSPVPNASPNARDAFRRNMREDIDIATSFKYVVDIEAEREKSAGTRGRQGRPISSSPEDAKAGPSSVASPKPPPVAGTATNTQNPQTPPKTSVKAQANDVTPETPSPSRNKGKRKVTFDIKPPVDKAPKDEQVGETAPAKTDEEDIFDLEDDDADAVREGSSQVSLPLVESPTVHTRPPRHRSNSGTAGLPQSLSALRPASLPAPSALRVIIGEEQPLSPRSAAKVNGGVSLSPEVLSPRETELARLVAASTPSHRSAWKKDSKAWKLFSNKSNSADPNDFEDVDEDAADEPGPLPELDDFDAHSNGLALPQKDWTQSIAASLPITIGPPSHPPKKPGFAPSTAQDLESRLPMLLETQGQVPVVASSVANRKAAYATRDRKRSLDPGALDFEADDGEDEDDKDEEADTESRGRRNALKILKARSELPSEGMWRSLAT